MADGSLVFDTKLDTSGLKNGLQGVGGVAQGAIGAMTKAIALTATAVAAGATLAINAGKEYETSKAKAQTMFGDVNVDLDNLDAKMLAMSSTTGKSAAELGQALYSALSAGLPVTEDMAGATDFLEQSAKLAIAGFTDVDTAVASTAKVLNAYNLDVSETARIQGILMATQNNGITTVGELSQTLAQVTPVAAAMGVQFEYVGAALATMTAKGTPTAQATTQLKSALAELGKSGTKAADALKLAVKGTEYAGMSFTDMMDAGVPLNDVLNMMSDYADANNMSVLDMFSSIEAGQAVLSLTGEGAALFTKNIAAMEDTAGLVDTAFSTMMNTFEGQTSVLRESAKNLGISIYNGMSSKLIDMAALANSYIAKLQEGFNTGGIDGLVKALGDVLSSVITKVAAALPSITTIATNLLTSLSDAMSTDENTKSIADGIAAALTAALGLADAIPDLLDAGLKIATKLITSIADKSPDFVPRIITALTNALIVLSENAPQLLASGLQLAQGIVTGIIISLPALLGGVLTIFQNLFTDKLKIDALFKDQFGATQAAYERFKKAIADADAKYDTTISDANAKKELANELLTAYDLILGKYSGQELPEAEKTRLQEIVQQLLDLYPQLNEAVNSNTGLLDANTASIRSNIDAITAQAIAAGGVEYLTNVTKAMYDASLEYKKGEIALRDAKEAAGGLYEQYAEMQEQYDAAGRAGDLDLQNSLYGPLLDIAMQLDPYLPAIQKAEEMLAEFQTALQAAKEEYELTKQAMEELNAEEVAGADAMAKAQIDYNKAVSDFASAQKNIAETQKAIAEKQHEIDNAGTRAGKETYERLQSEMAALQSQLAAQEDALVQASAALDTAKAALDEAKAATSDTADTSGKSWFEKYADKIKAAAQEQKDAVQSAISEAMAMRAQLEAEAAAAPTSELTDQISADAAAALATVDEMNAAIAQKLTAVLESLNAAYVSYQDTLALTGKDTAEIILNAMSVILTEEAGKGIADVYLAGMKDAVVAYEPTVKKSFTDVASHSHSALKSWNNAFYSAGVGYADNLASGIRSGQGSVATAVQSLLASALSAANKISSSYSVSSLPKYRTGLERVPVDDYPALLHKDEAVLTAAEARIWRSSILGGSRSSQTINIRDQVAAANNVNNGTIHVQLKIGEDVIAEIIEPIVSEKQADRAASMKG